MPDPLPRPDVNVTVDAVPNSTAQRVDLVVSRPGTGVARSFRGEASTVSGAVKAVVEKLLGDRGTGEYLP